MSTDQHLRNHAAFIWSVADKLRGVYKQSEYGRVILPLVVLRRLDCVLEPTKAEVLARHESLEGRVENVEPVLCAVSGEQFYNTSPLDFRRLLDVNMIGTFLFCREAMPSLVERKGVVVNLASVSATHAHPWMTAYSASKGAVLAFTIALASEYAADGVRAVAISPGGVATPLTASVRFPKDADMMYYARITPQIGEHVNEYVRFGRPEDIAGTIAFAASSDAAFLTGVEIRVDGGSHA